MAFSVPDIVITVLLLPFVVVCGLHACKHMADPWFTDRVLGCSRSLWNPRLYLYEVEHLVSPLLGGMSVIWVRTVAACLLLSGVCGGLLLLWPWPIEEESPALARACIILMSSSFFYFLTVVSYLVFTAQIELIVQSVVMIALGGAPMVYKVLYEWKNLTAEENTMPYSTFLYLVGALFLLAEAVVISWMHSNAPKCAMDMEHFHLIKNHFTENGMRWDPQERYPQGYSDSRLLLSV